MASQAWQITAPDQLSLVDVPKPTTPLGDLEVLVRIKAVAPNFRDILVVDHNPKYPAPTSPNLVPGCDGAGIVEDVGAGSTWKKGDTVLIHPNSWLSGSDVRSFDPLRTLGSGTMQGTLHRWAVW